MKTIRWIGGVALVGSVGVAAMVASASVGDPEVIRRADPIKQGLSPAAKGCLATWVATVWPTITAAALNGLECSGVGDLEAVTVTCTATDGHTYTEAEYIVAEEDGEVDKDTCTISGDATCSRKWGPAALNDAQEAALGACIEIAWPAADGDLLHELNIWPGTGAERFASYQYHAVISSGYLSLIDAGLIVERTGTVE
jgi:hypothetical protein